MNFKEYINEVLNEDKTISLKDITDISDKIRNSKIDWTTLDIDFKKITGKSMLDDPTTMNSFGRSFLTMSKLSNVTKNLTVLQNWLDRYNIKLTVIK